MKSLKINQSNEIHFRRTHIIMKGKIPKILSIALALVLVLSFSLVTAVSVAATPGAEISSTDIEGPYVVGVDQDFSVRTTSDTTYDPVLFKFVVEGAVLDDITSFEYLDATSDGWVVPAANPSGGTDTWINITSVLKPVGNNLEGFFGPSPDGFPMPAEYDVTTKFKINFNTPKTYPVTVSLETVPPETVITSTPFSVAVAGCVNTLSGGTYGTIEAAITAATTGDTINVAAGTYTEPQLIINKSLTILGAGQDDVTIQRSGGSSYFLNVSGAIDFTMKDLTIDASGSATTNFVAHISGLTSATFENVTVIGQGKDYTTDGQPYSYVDPTNNNIVGGLDLINVTSASLTNVTVMDVSRNGFSFTNVNIITLRDFTASNCGHTDSTGWAGLALYRNVEGESRLKLYGINSINNAPIGVNAHIISGTVRFSTYGSLSISDVLVPVVAPDTSNSDTFAKGIIPSAPYKVYATSGPSSGFASYFFADGDAIAAALDAFILFNVEHVVYDLATPKFIVGAGMKIQSAVAAASDGDTIDVLAGIYEEAISIMDKSLTLLGAQAGVPIVDGERAGDESIIRGPTTFCLVRIQNSDVVINGFTIEGAKQWSIAITGSSIRREGISNILVSYNYIVDGAKDGIFRDSAAADVTIDHNYIASNSRGILTNGGATTITDNMFCGNGQGIAFMGIDPYSVYFSDYAEPNYPTIISGNTFTDDSTSIYLRLDKGHQSITITGNDITGARNDAIRTGNTYDVDIVNPAIHHNNIVGSTNFGINNQVAEINLDALYNYWGDETGPDATLNLGAQGDAVSENVLFSPWLYETQENFVSDAPCYAGSVVLGNEATGVVVAEITSLKGGWNSFSTPVTLDGSADSVSKLLDLLTAEGSSSIVRAQRFDLSTQKWVALIMGGSLFEDKDYEIKPGEGFFIQVSTEGSLPILCLTTPTTSPPMTNLVAGWNLVGLSKFTGMTVVDALNKVDYSVVISPSPNAVSWSVPPLDKESMELGEAYWLGMGQPGILFGHTTTPVANDMTWGLNQN